jgi:hypothetical protein
MQQVPSASHLGSSRSRPQVSRCTPDPRGAAVNPTQPDAASIDPTTPTTDELVAITDVSALIDEVRSLRVALRDARLRAANLEAAARATLGAAADGERDPLFYLRDELEATP